MISINSGLAVGIEPLLVPIPFDDGQRDLPAIAPGSPQTAISASPARAPGGGADATALTAPFSGPPPVGAARKLCHCATPLQAMCFEASARGR